MGFDIQVGFYKDLFHEFFCRQMRLIIAIRQIQDINNGK